MESGQTKIASFVVGLRLARELGADAWYLANGVSGEAPDAGVASGTLALRVTALERRISHLLAAAGSRRSARDGRHAAGEPRSGDDDDRDLQRRRSTVEP